MRLKYSAVAFDSPTAIVFLRCGKGNTIKPGLNAKNKKA